MKKVRQKRADGPFERAVFYLPAPLMALIIHQSEVQGKSKCLLVAEMIEEVIHRRSVK